MVFSRTRGVVPIVALMLENIFMARVSYS
jgi:hypothetical protein